MEDLRQEIQRAFDASYPDCACRAPRERNKLRGALTVEILKARLEELGLPVSPRDVFIRGLPIEIDLLIPKRESVTLHNCVYEPKDVLAVLEVKFSGAYNEQTCPTIKAIFERVRSVGPHIQCIYVTVCERASYKWKVTSERLGFPAFTLYWEGPKAAQYQESGEWSRLVEMLAKPVRTSLSPPSSS